MRSFSLTRLLLIGLLVFVVPGVARGEENSSNELSDAESGMVDAINRYRADRKLPRLKVDRVLMRIARQRVDVFHHNHPRFGWCGPHARRAGFPGFVTDNIARGYPSPELAVGNSRSGWGCETPGRTVGHDMQMKGYAKVNGRWVNYKFDRVGVAVRGRQYIAVFGKSHEPRDLKQEP